MPYFFRVENANEDKHAYYPSIPETGETAKYIPVASSLDEMFTIVPHEELIKLQNKGYKINVYYSNACNKFGDQTVIRRNTSELVQEITLLS